MDYYTHEKNILSLNHPMAKELIIFAIDEFDNEDILKHLLY
jgi:hypothetical protein